MRALTEKQHEALSELASGLQPTLYHRQYAKTGAALVKRGLVEVGDAGTMALTAEGHAALAPKTTGRKRLYNDQADKQREYRRRKDNAEFTERNELQRIKAVVLSILRQQGDYIAEEGTQGIINGLYRLQRATEGQRAAPRDFDFPNF